MTFAEEDAMKQTLSIYGIDHCQVLERISLGPDPLTTLTMFTEVLDRWEVVCLPDDIERSEIIPRHDINLTSSRTVNLLF